MKVTVIDVYPKPSSLESERGILVNGVVVLPDPLSPGEVLVRPCHSLATTVRVIENGEITVKVPNESSLNEAISTHIYTLGWFKGFFENHWEGIDKQFSKGN